jgi:hypothetical protein
MLRKELLFTVGTSGSGVRTKIISEKADPRWLEPSRVAVLEG